LGAGGRHNPPYATVLCASKLNFRDSVKAKFADCTMDELQAL
jgi:hypothetical protein